MERQLRQLFAVVVELEHQLRVRDARRQRPGSEAEKLESKQGRQHHVDESTLSALRADSPRRIE